eukprot:979700-Amorphochlora_amoeboformis.AAC.2
MENKPEHPEYALESPGFVIRARESEDERTEGRMGRLFFAVFVYYNFESLFILALFPLGFAQGTKTGYDLGMCTYTCKK